MTLFQIVKWQQVSREGLSAAGDQSAARFEQTYQPGPECLRDQARSFKGGKTEIGFPITIGTSPKAVVSSDTVTRSSRKALKTFQALETQVESVVPGSNEGICGLSSLKGWMPRRQAILIFEQAFHWSSTCCLCRLCCWPRRGLLSFVPARFDKPSCTVEVQPWHQVHPRSVCRTCRVSASASL